MLRNWHININRLRQIPESKGKQKTKKKKTKETDKQTKNQRNHFKTTPKSN